MADLIDRDAVIWITAETGALETQRRVKELPAVNRWIPCSERLPEDGELVLIAHVSGAVYIADRDGKYWEEDSGEWYDGENVTHWMPMPEPPEGGADNG